MTARILPFPDFFRPASPRDGEEPCLILILESRAKEPEANARSAVTTSGRLAMGSSRPVTGRSVTATSERTDVTAGETALIFPRECPKVQELRRQSKRLREHFKAKRQ
jgi:hypothetical protein